MENVANITLLTCKAPDLCKGSCDQMLEVRGVGNPGC